MAGWIDACDQHHEGDGIARLVYSAERGWALWFTCEVDGQTVLSQPAGTRASRLRRG